MGHRDVLSGLIDGPARWNADGRAIVLGDRTVHTWRTFAEAVGGQWQEVTRTTFNDITDIALNGNEGVMVGLNGTILLTDNAGEKWQAVQ